LLILSPREEIAKIPASLQAAKPFIKDAHQLFPTADDFLREPSRQCAPLYTGTHAIEDGILTPFVTTKGEQLLRRGSCRWCLPN